MPEPGAVDAEVGDMRLAGNDDELLVPVGQQVEIIQQVFSGVAVVMLATYAKY